MTKIKVENLNLQRPQSVRVFLSQFSINLEQYVKNDGLLFYKDTNEVRVKVQQHLDMARQQAADVIAFPELFIPENFIKNLQEWSIATGATIIAGSHYHFDNEKQSWCSRCPVIIAGKVFFIGKTTPSPHEISPIVGRGLMASDSIFVFNNTPIGNFAVLICADYLMIENRSSLYDYNLDFLFVIAYQKDSNLYHSRIANDISENNDGIYVLYINQKEKKSSDGRTAFFGAMDNIFCNELLDVGLTNLEPSTKVCELGNKIFNVTLDVNIDIKKPVFPRNVHTKPNISIQSFDKKSDPTESKFIDHISHDDERYRRIDSLYILPKEYQSILDRLDKNGLVFIVGDPGIGKTYTAVRIMKNYFESGYEPIWVPGLEKSERRLLRQTIERFEPKSKQIIYFEDPFGRTEYESRDSIALVFGPLRERLSDIDSKVIVTSRHEVFERFTKEYPSITEINELKEEMSVVSPSYSLSDLKDIMKNLAYGRCKWFQNQNLRKIVENGIEVGLLNTPFAIRDLIFSTQSIVNKDELEKRIENRKSETISVFSREIQSTSSYNKLVLFLVFLFGFRSRLELNTWYSKVVKNVNNLETNEKIPVFAQVIREELGFRIEQYGPWKVGYRLTHPVYEDAIWKLFEYDIETETIVYGLIGTVVNDDIATCLSGIKKCVIKYPNASNKMYSTVIKFVKKRDHLFETSKVGLALISTFDKTSSKNILDKLNNLTNLSILIQKINLEKDILSLEFSLRFLLNILLRTREKKRDPSYGIKELKQLKNEHIYYKLDTCMHPVQVIKILELIFSIERDSVYKYLINIGENGIVNKFSSIPREAQSRLISLLPTRSKFAVNVSRALKHRWKKYQQYSKHGLKIHLLRNAINSNSDLGSICIDNGAIKVLSRKRRSNGLLPVGVTEVEGTFEVGDLIQIKNTDDDVIGAGFVEYNSDDLRVVRGHHTSQVSDLVIRRPLNGEVIRPKKYWLGS